MAYLTQAAAPANRIHYFSTVPEFPVVDRDFRDRCNRGLPIPSELVPRQAIVSHSRNKKVHLLDLEAYHGDKIWAVSQRLRQIFDELAPGQAEFLELDLRLENGEPAAPTPYYFVNFLRRFPSIVWAQSEFEVSPEPDSRGQRQVIMPKVAFERTRITVSRAADPTAEVWHDVAYDSQFGAYVFMSDKVVSAIKAEKIMGLWTMKVLEV